MTEARRAVVNVVGWNSLGFLPNLLTSLDQQDTNDFTVTVVDNGSSDGTAQWLQANRPDVTVLRNFRNQGFSRGHNQAVSLAFSRWTDGPMERRYVIVANPDLEFAPDAVRLLVAYMDAHPEIVACGPKLLRAFVQSAEVDGSRETVRSRVIDSTGIAVTRSRRFVDRGAGEEDQGQYDRLTEVFGISGACAVYRASSLLNVRIGEEYFDEDFFAYKEDADLAWRLRIAGGEASFVPYALVWHHRQAPSAPRSGRLASWKKRWTKSPWVNYLSTRNHGWLLVKNDEPGNALLHLAWWFPYEAAKFVSSFFSWSQFKAQAASLFGWPKMLKKRSEIRRRAKVAGKRIRKWFV